MSGRNLLTGRGPESRAQLGATGEENSPLLTVTADKLITTVFDDVTVPADARMRFTNTNITKLKLVRNLNTRSHPLPGDSRPEATLEPRTVITKDNTS